MSHAHPHTLPPGMAAHAQIPNAGSPATLPAHSRPNPATAPGSSPPQGADNKKLRLDASGRSAPGQGGSVGGAMNDMGSGECFNVPQLS